MEEIARTFALRLEARERLAEFVETELDLGITFAKIALGADSQQKARRNCANARRAFESANHFLSKLDGTEGELRPEIDGKLEQLRQLIEKLDR
jgi:hypothetical protein